MAISGKNDGVIRLTAENDKIEEKLDINSIKWFIKTGAVAGDLCEIKNTNGTIIFESVCDTADQFMDKDEVNLSVDGIKLTDLDRGEVLIYLRDRARSFRA